ncbi:thiolase family protein [Alicyclobacillus tolerans]|uniref:thiolase family protein n=1 Tax=Alicyclobacillus tolerans TaxID=90970 RepID=UPI001F44FBCB|nr:thiolase family protein [Alicyclobacillus tolerans]MCF8568089.1 thiolase family protein [Alicyclobacillus tolerans]
MREAVIVDAVRTPFGRYRGKLKSVRPDDLAAWVIRALLDRNPQLNPEAIEDVVFGAANQAGEDNRNVARMALLLAGLPVSVGGVTVNRLCGSSLEAVNVAAAHIMTGTADVMIAGGVESMSRAPLVMLKAEEELPRGNQEIVDTTIGWRFINPNLAKMHYPYSMGETAENVAKRYEISRAQQDEFALMSQQRTAKAWDEGRYQDHIVPVEVSVGRAKTEWFDKDEHMRPDTTYDKLAKLRPAFRENGTVTAGNSSGINDGASAVLVVEKEIAMSLGLNPLARVVSYAAVGVDPAYMGMGPLYATRKLLSRTGLSISDIDLVELNEAFASQSLACIRELRLDTEKVNVNGGAIAIGHPLGASGARILGELVHELKRRGGRYGIATMCIGVGQGIATLVERVES